jgi:hypothetical protein
MTTHSRTIGLNRTIKAPIPTCKHSSVPAPLASYLLHSSCALGFFLFILWLAGLGS